MTLGWRDQLITGCSANLNHGTSSAHDIFSDKVKSIFQGAGFSRQYRSHRHATGNIIERLGLETELQVGSVVFKSTHA